MRIIFLFMLLLLRMLSFSATSSAGVDLNKIMIIESSGNPLAYNVTSGAIGLFQITPICLKEWNNYHKTQQYKSKDLYSAEINTKIAKWYLNKRIPQMLKYFKKEVSLENILISYNAGINYVVTGKKLPKETRKYIIKYKSM